MSKFKLTQTATEVQNILNNSLQKPTGLTKTKLVGVGVNGQENIEIGDNLTLANGKLAATGSLPSTVKFDQEGNRTVGKDLGVDGKLKLKSLVSASNPDGDITKELGGGELYCHHIELIYNGSSGGHILIDYYSKDQKQFTTIKQFASAFNRKYLICSGYVKIDGGRYTPVQIRDQLEKLYVDYLNSSYVLSELQINNWNFNDSVYKVD